MGPARLAWRGWPLVWLVVAGVIGWLLGPSYLDALRPRRTKIVDFIQEWCSARNYMAGTPIYGPLEPTIQRELNQARDPDDRMFFDLNTHPPFSVLLTLPFGRLDYPDAVLAWNLCGLPFLVLSLWLVRRQLHLAPMWWAPIAAVPVLLICYPFEQQIEQGQLNCLLMFLVTASWAADRSDRPVWAGIAAGLAMAVKLFPGLLLIYFLLRRRWVAAAVMLGTFLLANLATVAVLGLATYQTYLRDILPAATVKGRTGWPNASITGIWWKLFGTLPPEYHPLWYNEPLARAGVIVCSALLFALLARATWRARTPADGEHAFAATVVAMLLLSISAWEHYFLVLLVPLALLWVRGRDGGWPRIAFWLILVCLLAPTALLYEWLIPGGWKHGIPGPMQTLTVLSFQFYALFALFGLSLPRNAAPAIEPQIGPA
jgi:hypothetical protein